MSESALSWHKLVSSELDLDFQENGIALVEASGEKLCVSKWKGQWHGFAYRCPHAGGFLSEADMDGKGNIICPVHGYKFSLRTGYNVSGEGYQLKKWPLDWRADGLYVGMESSSLSNPPL